MNRIGEGDLSTRIQMSGEDELQQISRRFNDMGDRLGQYIDKMYTSEIKQKRGAGCPAIPDQPPFSIQYA